MPGKVSELHIYLERELARSSKKSEASFLLTAQTKAIERDWNSRPRAPSISAI
jgi:hypothetical protein